jgi:hypothetical protein
MQEQNFFDFFRFLLPVLNAGDIEFRTSLAILHNRHL